VFLYFFIQESGIQVTFCGIGNMTRFARARGSKSSNQKIPEEATPWLEMKEKPQQTENDESTTDAVELL